MIRIRTLDDPRLTAYRHVSDHQWLLQQGLFVAEGRLVVRRLLPNPRFRTKSVLLTEAAWLSMRDALGSIEPDVFVVEQRTMNDVAGFNIHRGCLAIAERAAVPALQDLSLESLTRLVLLEGVNNPDNVGGIFRSAGAFGVDAVVLGPACSDPLYRKSVRTSMAAALAVPFASAGPWPDAIRSLREHGIHVVALTPAAEATPLDEVSRDIDRAAILVGAEGPGLSREAMDAASRHVRIPMSGAADSLNVTVAASIALHWFHRNRRQPHGP